MDRAAILSDKDAVMLQEFSRRSLGRLAGHSLFGALPFFSTYYDANIQKESDKDRLIIKEAATAFAAGRPVCDLDLEDIFERTKIVDKAFLGKLRMPPLQLSVRYGEIADIRIRRIGRIAGAVYDLLAHWPDGDAFGDAVRKAYTDREFRDVIVDILQLYSRETRMLGRSLHVLPPFGGPMRSFAEALFEAMEKATEGLADEYAGKIFGDVKTHV